MVGYRENVERGGLCVMVFGARLDIPTLNMPAENGPGQVRSHADRPDSRIGTLEAPICPLASGLKGDFDTP